MAAAPTIHVTACDSCFTHGPGFAQARLPEEPQLPELHTTESSEAPEADPFGLDALITHDKRYQESLRTELCMPTDSFVGNDAINAISDWQTIQQCCCSMLLSKLPLT